MKDLYLRTTAMGVAALMGVGASAVTATAQDIASLEARVAELEAEAERPRFSFAAGDNTNIEIYGFVRFETFYDFDFEQGDLSLIGALNTLPTTDGAFNTSVRVSRLGVRVDSETDIGTISGQLEYDLFGSGGTAELRLRHANVQLGGFLLGQFWTNFMPISHYPTTADFNGPVGITFARVPQIRYTGEVADLTYSVSLEETAGSSNDPIATAALAYDHDMFSARIAGLVGTQRGVGGGAQDDIFGVTVSGTANLWQGGHLGATYTQGEGIGFLLIGGGDSVVAGNAVEVEGFTLEARQTVGDFDFGIAYGQEDYDTGLALTSISELETVHVNGFWRPTDNFSLGLEYINGTRTDFTGSELEAERVGASVTFTF